MRHHRRATARVRGPAGRPVRSTTSTSTGPARGNPVKPSGSAAAIQRRLPAAAALGGSIAVALATACSAPVNHSDPAGRSSVMSAGTHTAAAVPAAWGSWSTLSTATPSTSSRTAGTLRVRVLGINAPELDHDGQPAECYGLEATARTRDLLLGRPVALTGDPTQPQQDRYQRLLRYVDIAGSDLGQLLIEGGYATRIPPVPQGPTQRTASYLTAQNQAQSRRAGLWGACPATTRRPNTVPCTAGPRHVVDAVASRTLTTVRRSSASRLRAANPLRRTPDSVIHVLHRKQSTSAATRLGQQS